MGNRLKNVFVIGGGIVGLSCAYYLLKHGVGVTVLDRDRQADEKCSTGNAGMIVPSHFVPLAAPGMVKMGMKMMLNPRSPFAFKFPPTLEQILWSYKFMSHCNQKHVDTSETILRDLNMGSRKEYELMSDDLGIGYQLEKRGLLMLFRTQQGLDHEAVLAGRANEIGLRASVLSASGTKLADPDIDMDVLGSIHFHDDCNLSPDQFMNALRIKITEMGGEIKFGHEVAGFELSNGKVSRVKTNNGSFDADEVIIAAGTWSGSVSKQLNLRLPMMAGKGYSMMVGNPVQRPRLCSLLMEARVAVTPMVDGVRFGGTMEIGPPDHSINKQRVDGIIHSIPNYFPKMKPADFEGLPVWHGHRPCSPDGLPYVGRMSHLANVTIATGHSMMGMSLGPITGKLVSELITGQPTSLPLNQLDPNRYA